MKILILTLLTFTSLFLNAQSEYTVRVSDDIIHDKLNRMHFGAFWEYFGYIVNGSYGLTAQEIAHGGFDHKKSDNSDIAFPWAKYNTKDAKSTYYLESGGINKRGLYSQTIYSDTNDIGFGVAQNIFLDKDTSYTFSIYTKTDNLDTKYFVAFWDTIYSKKYYQVMLEPPRNKFEWERKEVKIPFFESPNRLRITIYKEGKGNTSFDEASLLPDNQKYQLKRKVFDTFKKWKPGIFRYPGGWFADLKNVHLEAMSGPLEQRTSPMFDWTDDSQKMDFGLDEVYQFCKDIGCEPHIVTNVLRGTPEQSLNMVEYANGDTNTKYGLLRKSYGFDNMNIKYWEPGNELYLMGLTIKDYATSSNNHMKLIKEKYPEILTMHNFQIWHNKNEIDSNMMYVKDYTDIVSYHHGASLDENHKNNDTTTSFCMLSANNKFVNDFQIYIEKLSDKYKSTKFTANTELWMAYKNNYSGHDFWRTKRLQTVESAMWNTLQICDFFSFSDKMLLNERTINSGMFDVSMNSKGERVVVESVSSKAMILLTNHFGNNVHSTIVNGEKINTDIDNCSWVGKINWLNAYTTSDKDSIYITLINKNPYSSHTAYLDLPISSSKYYGKYYLLAGNGYLDKNTADEPNRIDIKEYPFENVPRFVLPPSSMAVVSIAKNPKLNLTNQDNLKIYYSNKRLYFNTDSINNIRIYNITGHLLYSSMNTPSDQILDLDFLSNGVYFLSYTELGINKIMKIIE